MLRHLRWGFLFFILTFTTQSQAQDAGKAVALRLNAIITGGIMPVSDPIFTQMVAKVQAGDIYGAAELAAKSKYFASYLARRLALQMMTPALDASQGTDNDASAFLIAKFAGAAGSPPSISSIWSDNATYTLNLGGTATVRAAALTQIQKDTIDWSAVLVRQPGQFARSANAGNAPLVQIPAKHVGGYTTLSDRANDNSFAMFGATAGTNLRFIEGIWQISTGLSLLDVSSSNALVQDVPRFIPQYDPNFFIGQGQAACISCHGGGMPSNNHGYAAVADIYDFTNNGFVFTEASLTRAQATTNNTLKSLGSDPSKRTGGSGAQNCNLAANPKPVCNPDGTTADLNQSWNVGTTWGSSGVLTTMGWTGPTAGQGLNELGQAIGKAGIVYSFLVKRVVNELCPLGSISLAEVNKIAAAANPNAIPKGTDDIRTIVAMVASHKSCM
jgi:hypothetical protein